MNLTKVKESLTYQDTAVKMDIGGEEFTFNVHRTVPIDKTEEFVNIVLSEVIRGGSYHFALLEPSIDYATIATFTDIDLREWNRDEIHALIYTTNIMEIIEAHMDHVYPYELRIAARTMIEYYLELSKPQSNSEKAYEALTTLLMKLDNFVSTLNEKVNAFDVSDETIEKLSGLADKLDAVNDEEKILQLVLDKED